MPVSTISSSATVSRSRSSVLADGGEQSTRDQAWPGAEGVMGHCRTCRMLIVDDDPQVLTLVSRMVSCMGHAADSAGDAMEAIFQLNQRHYDLVLTDYKMPLVDGYQLAARIKKRYAGTKVILMTGYCEEALQRMVGAGQVLDGLLIKPFNLSTLKDKIDAVDPFPLDALSR